MTTAEVLTLDWCDALKCLTDSKAWTYPLHFPAGLENGSFLKHTDVYSQP